jgi:hypothetical protein
VNILIIGGLFAVAILAIIGIVLLSLSERGAEAARKANLQSPAPTIAKTARPTVPLTPADNHESAARPVAKEPAIQRRTFPRQAETASASSDHEENALLPMLNGQFHEFVDELRDLHQQAWELEHRLSTLTQMVDRIERSQPHHISIEEDDEETFNVEDAQE